MSEVISTGAIIIFLMLLMYMVLGTIIEHFHMQFGHEAAYTILIGKSAAPFANRVCSLGMLISYISWHEHNEEFTDLVKFSGSTFFFICLPPIVFASGFNMQRGNFFSNIANIMCFGVIGTFVAFFSFSFMTIYLKNMNFMQ